MIDNETIKELEAIKEKLSSMVTEEQWRAANASRIATRTHEEWFVICTYWTIGNLDDAIESARKAWFGESDD